jgi:hypothetical protein
MTTLLDFYSALGALPKPKLYAASYDLNTFGQDYSGIILKLEGMGAVRVQLSHWWVTSTSTAAALRNELMPYIDYNDSLLVAELSGEVSGWENREDLRNWMNAALARRAA